MVDFQMDIHKNLNPDEETPADLQAKREAVVVELMRLQVFFISEYAFVY